MLTKTRGGGSPPPLNHFGTEYTSVSRKKSVSYTTGNNTTEYSYQTTGTDEDEKLSADSVKYNDNVVLSSSYEYDSNGNPFKKIYSYKDNNEIYNVDFLSEYDNDGKITGMGYDNISTHYYYDSDSQLTRVDSDLNEPYTETFSYDTRGNIISRKVYDYTRAENISSEPNETTTFTYKQNGWIDQLEYVNGTRLEYDDNGNVTKFGNKEYTWVNGRNLAHITDGENTYSYTYDEDGIRTSKTVSGVTTYYNTKDGVILSQTDGTNTMYFQYDTSGAPLGFIYNGMQYFYMTNQMGDVIAINDCNGNILAQYVYDEWGKVIAQIPVNESDEEAVALVNANPIRYRGYYYDNETGYYYLQSRYYDPSICRFINSDIAEISQMSKDIPVDTNLFAYCCNDPVNNSDPTGFINWDLEFGRASITSSVLSAIGTISLLAFRKTPWGKIISMVITLTAIATNVYSYAKAMKSAKSLYGKNTNNYRILRRYNNIVLITSVALAIISDVLGSRIVKQYSTTIAVALLGCRTVTIIGLSINLGELLSGKKILYRDKLWRR